MKVHLFATLRQLAGVKTVELPARADRTVRVLLEELGERYPELGAKLFDEAGRPQPYIHVFVNGRETPYLPDGLDTRIGPDDSLNIFPSIAGGSRG